MSINVEHLFSCGHLLLSHVCSQLSTQSTHAILCLRMWSKCNLVMDNDMKRVSKLQDVEGNGEVVLEGWLEPYYHQLTCQVPTLHQYHT